MTILAHTCCADCLLHLAEGFKNNNKMIVYFDNPNIHPRSEMLSRLAAVKKVASGLGIDKVIVADWQPAEFFKSVGESKNKGVRCIKCWDLRLARLAVKAKELGIIRITTTMLTSNYLNQKKIIEIGQKLAKDNGLELVVPKGNNHDCRYKGFYKQNYCGCVYSLLERLEEKYSIPKCHQD